MEMGRCAGRKSCIESPRVARNYDRRKAPAGSARVALRRWEEPLAGRGRGSGPAEGAAEDGVDGEEAGAEEENDQRGHQKGERSSGHEFVGIGKYGAQGFVVGGDVG